MKLRELAIRTGLILPMVPLALVARSALSQPRQPDLPLFADDATLDLTLEAPLRSLGRSTRTRDEFDAVMRYTDASGTSVALDLEVRIRGNSRLEVCDFPPLRLDFPRSQLGGTIFEGQNRLKLVTLCKRQSRYRDYLALEYDIYRLFNVLTDRSFRVRRANVTYVETDGRRDDSFTEPAFLIEDDGEVAARHGGELLETPRIELSALDADHTALLGIFQFMVGNTDWSALRGPGEEDCCHNGAVFAASDGAAIVIPYDFDQSGLINTEYSAPPQQLPIRRVTQRYYRGFCAQNAAVERQADYVVRSGPALQAVIESGTATEGAKENALGFLRRSLEILADPAERAEEIIEQCRS